MFIFHPEMKLGKSVLLLLLLLLVSAITKGETGFSRDSLVTAIRILEKQKPSLGRDSVLMFYYNDLCEKSIFGNDPKAEEYLKRFQKAQEKSIWPIGEALYLRAVGKKFDKLGQYEEAIENYLSALRIMEQHNSIPEHIVYTKILLGFVMLNSGNEVECWRLFREAEPEALKLKNSSHAIWILDFYGDNTLFHAKTNADYEKALAYYKRVEALLPNSLIKNQIPNNLQGQAAVYDLMNNRVKAREYRAKALEQAKLIPNYFVQFFIYSDYAKAAEEEGDYTEAVNYRELAIAAADSQGYLEFLNRGYYELYLTYKESGDTKNALEALEEYQVLEDSLKRQEVNEKYAELNGKYEFEKQQLAIRNLENKTLRYGLIALAVSLLAGLLLLLFQNRSKKKIAELNKRLSQRNTEVEEALYEGKKIERRRVSDRLHDHIATKVSALKWKIEAREETLDPRLYTDLVDDLTKIYEDVRGMAHELRPLEFLDKGLERAVEELFSDLKEKSNASFEVYLSPDIDQIEKSIQYHMYQVTSELCTNLKKHSKPEKVIFYLDSDEEYLRLYMANDGVISGALREGQGLRNIRNKVSGYNGTAQIRKDEFFTVEIRIPLVQ